MSPEAALDAAIHAPAPLDDAAMLELHEWPDRRSYVLFGGLRPCDQQDALQETFLRTLEFADKMSDPQAIHGACFTNGLRVRASRIGEYIQERGDAFSDSLSVSWNSERHLFEKDRRRRSMMAICNLHASDREILQRFYFGEQVRQAMQLTKTEFWLRKNRAITRAGYACEDSQMTEFKQ